jgi:hypothetical protein
VVQREKLVSKAKKQFDRELQEIEEEAMFGSSRPEQLIADGADLIKLGEDRQRGAVSHDRTQGSSQATARLCPVRPSVISISPTALVSKPLASQIAIAIARRLLSFSRIKNHCGYPMPATLEWRCGYNTGLGIRSKLKK